MRPFFRKLKWLTERRGKEDELSEELEFHLEQEAEERQAEGISGKEARCAAQRDLGNVTLVREETRATWGWVGLEQVAQDVRYGLRAMIHNRAFTALAVLSLALGIGANVAIYSFMDTLLLRSLPVADPESLAVLNWQTRGGMKDSVVHGGSGNINDEPGGGMSAGIFPYPAFELLRTSSDGVFSSVFAHRGTRKVNLMVKGHAELASGEYVSGDYFRGLAVTPAAGRAIGPDDDRIGAAPVAVLSFAYSQRRFGDAASAVGQPILINNLPFTVAGVAPPGFFGVDPAAALDFYIPLHADLAPASDAGPAHKEYLDGNFYWINLMARLRPGVSMARAEVALGPVFHRWIATTAANERERADLPALVVKEGAGGLDTLRRRYSEPLYVLLAMVVLILAIACANIASLLLARATARQREMAIRLSIGAGRFRVIRQLLTESLLLAGIGGALGVLFAVWGIRFLTLLLESGDNALRLHAELNWHVLGAALALSMLTGLLFGLAPALQLARVDPAQAMKESQGVTRQRRVRWSVKQALVVSQIALSLLMLIGAGLFVRTLANLQSIQLGFNRDNLLLFRMNAKQAGHKEPKIVEFYSDLQKQFSAIPGVREASLANSPLVGEGSWFSRAVPVGEKPKPGLNPHILMTGTDFFTTMQIPVLLGRGIDDRDRPGSQKVAVVNEVYAKAYFGDRSPLGRHITMDRGRPLKDADVEIVGVAKNARYGDLKGDYPPVVYVAFNQDSAYAVEEMTFALRTSGDPLGFANAVRGIVHRADPRVPVSDIRTEAEQIDQTMSQEIAFAKLCTGFGILALVIACVGLYGTMTYSVARRTGEIGVRMALGAERGRVIRMVLRQAIAMVAFGLAMGVALAYAASHLVASFLYGIKPNDPAALGIAAGTLAVAVLVAAYAPARRASRIDPMAALRHE